MSTASWSIHASGLRELVFHLLPIKKPVNIYATMNDLSTLSEDESIAFLSLINLPNISFYKLDKIPQFQHSSYLTATVSHANVVAAWANAETKAIQGNQHWGSIGVFVKGFLSSQLKVEARIISPADFKLQRNDGDQELVIHHDFDGALAEFGKKFWEAVVDAHAGALEVLSKERISNIQYSDKYLFTPISLSTIKEIIVGLRSHMGFELWKSVPLVVKTSASRSSEYKGRHGYLYSDWLNSEERNKVLVALFENVGITTTVETTQQHSRALNIHFESGKTLTIRFDQGVSYWRLRTSNYRHSASPYFDFELSSIEQAKKIHALKDIEIQGANAPTELFIKIR